MHRSRCSIATARCWSRTRLPAPWASDEGSYSTACSLVRSNLPTPRTAEMRQGKLPVLNRQREWTGVKACYDLWLYHNWSGSGTWQTRLVNKRVASVMSQDLFLPGLALIFPQDLVWMMERVGTLETAFSTGSRSRGPRTTLSQFEPDEPCCCHVVVLRICPWCQGISLLISAF